MCSTVATKAFDTLPNVQFQRHSFQVPYRAHSGASIRMMTGYLPERPHRFRLRRSMKQTAISIYLSIYLAFYLAFYLSIYLSILLSTYPSLYLSTYLPTNQSINQSINQSNLT